MKENFFQRLRRRWNETPAEDKKLFIGSALGSFGTALISGLVIARRDQKWIDAGCNIADQESKKAYYKGLQDGQIKAYQDMLMRPEGTFNKMGMEVKKF